MPSGVGKVVGAAVGVADAVAVGVVVGPVLLFQSRLRSATGKGGRRRERADLGRRRQPRRTRQCREGLQPSNTIPPIGRTTRTSGLATRLESSLLARLHQQMARQQRHAPAHPPEAKAFIQAQRRAVAVLGVDGHCAGALAFAIGKGLVKQVSANAASLQRWMDGQTPSLAPHRPAHQR